MWNWNGTQDGKGAHNYVSGKGPHKRRKAKSNFKVGKWDQFPL